MTGRELGRRWTGRAGGRVAGGPCDAPVGGSEQGHTDGRGETEPLNFELVAAEILEIEGNMIDIEAIGEAGIVGDLPGELMSFNG